MASVETVLFALSKDEAAVALDKPEDFNPFEHSNWFEPTTIPYVRDGRWLHHEVPLCH